MNFATFTPLPLELTAKSKGANCLAEIGMGADAYAKGWGAGIDMGGWGGIGARIGAGDGACVRGGGASVRA